MPDVDVRELRDELAEFKLDVVQRLVRIETKLEQQQAQAQLHFEAKQQPAPQSEVGATQVLSKVSTGLVESGKLVLQIVLAVVASLLAVKGSGSQ